jgi:RND family efflux transporter MFP subunit
VSRGARGRAGRRDRPGGWRRARRGALHLAGASLLACAPAQDEPPIEFHVPVVVRDVRTGTVEGRIVATGTLRTAEGVALRADTGGELLVARDARGRRLNEGDRVAAGQAIAEITGEQVRVAARTEATRQRYEAALRDHDSKRRLFDQGLLSEQELRQAETALADSKMELDQSRLTETRSRLVTPIAGLILHLARDEDGTPLADGQLVTQGFVVARIAPTSGLIADVDLVGIDVARAREGMSARVRHHAYDERRFDGRVVRLAPSLDPTTRTLRAEVAVDNAEGLLRPGMFVEVTLIAERRENVPVVPRDALTERGDRAVVFVLQGQRASRREVVPGLGDDEIVEIRHGLEPGERVVVGGLETLTDGTRVRVVGS